MVYHGINESVLTLADTSYLELIKFDENVMELSGSDYFFSEELVQEEHSFLQTHNDLCILFDNCYRSRDTQKGFTDGLTSRAPPSLI